MGSSFSSTWFEGLWFDEVSGVDVGSRVVPPCRIPAAIGVAGVCASLHRKTLLRLRKFLQHFCSDLHTHGFDAARLNDNYVAYQPGEKNVGLAVAAKKGQRIFRFPRKGGDRIRIDDIREVRLGGHLQREPDESPRQTVVEREIGEFVVNVAIEDYDVGIAFACAV